jgi:hypothetical protein
MQSGLRAGSRGHSTPQQLVGQTFRTVITTAIVILLIGLFYVAISVTSE